MKHSFIMRNFITAAFALLTLSLCAQPVYRSPAALAVDETKNCIYIAEETGSSVAIFKLDSLTVDKRITLTQQPRALELFNQNASLLVAGGVENGRVFIVNTKDATIDCEIEVGHTPTDLAITKDGKTAFVANRFSNTVSVIDITAKKVVATVPVGREPSGVALGDQDKKLFIMNHQPQGPANGDFIAVAIQVLDVASRKVTKNLLLPNGSAVGRSIRTSPDGKYAYAAHALARYQLPTTQLERGWMTTNAVSVIDCTTASYVNTFLLDDVELGSANPWAVSVSKDGKRLAVTAAGANEVSIIDRLALHERLDKVAKNVKVTSVSSTAADVPNDLSFLVGIRQRIRTKGLGPRSVAFAKNTVVAGEYFTDSIAILDDAQTPLNRIRTVPVTPVQPMTPERKGEMLFNSADICFQQWQSCATCHPDGRADGLNWDLLNDGMGNPKQTKSLLLSHRTPPTMISGIRKNAEVCVRAGIRYIQFAVRPDEDAQALDAYCKAMKPVPSPFRVKGQLSEAAKRGQAIYVKAGCAVCHPIDELMTDMKSYNLKMQDEMDKGKPWDTPTIIETWRTAPYLFDGRSATMRDMLAKHNPNDIHGKTSTLSEQELADLEAFILSW